MAEPLPGMDHDLYEFSPILGRSPLTWPGGKAVAGCIFLYIEHWDLIPEKSARTDPRFVDRFGAFQPDYRTYTWREYGNRVGIFRLLEALDALNLKVTVALNAKACTRYPALIESLVERNHEFVVHGIDATQMITQDMSEAQEREFIQKALTIVRDATGRSPVGWISQDHSQSTRTPQLLDEAGFAYCVDWPNDDQPYPMLKGRNFISIPAQSEWDDVQLLWHRRVLSSRFPTIISEAVECLKRDAERDQSGRYMSLHLHPWLSGMPHRFRYTVEALKIFAETSNLWQAYAGEVAAHTADQRKSISAKE